MFKFVAFFFLALPVPQQDWRLISDKDGIRIYALATPTESKTKPVKVECTFNATPSQLVAVLLDIKNYPAWVYRTTTTEIIKKVSPTDIYYYSEVNIPWPAQNRDFVSHITVTQNSETHAIVVDAPNVSGMVPVKTGIYRLTASKAKWIITPVGNNESRVVYELWLDTSGSAPAWLVNMFATEGPMQTFKNLRVQIPKPIYKSK